MGTLCNACGINYRRALAKSSPHSLDLDALSRHMGHAKLSIQKALKRQRKIAAPPSHQFKRLRSPTASVASIRSPISTSNSESPASLRRILSDTTADTARGSASSSTTIMVTDSAHWQAPVMSPCPRATASNAGVASTSTPPPLNALRHDNYTSHSSLFSHTRSDQHRDHSRLPPFETFIGELQQRYSNSAL